MPNPPTIADRAALAAVAEESRALILRWQDSGGAYPASPTFSVYRGFAWLRDGSFIADAMSAAGEADSATAFFDWVAGVLMERADRVAEIVQAAAEGTPVPDERMLPTRFRLDGTDGDDEWWDFQLDGYGTWLWAAAAHARRHRIDLSRWSAAIGLTIDYLASSWERPCYDWWEEHSEHVHVSTLGCIASGLHAVAGSDAVSPERAASAIGTADDALRLLHTRGVVDGHLVKWIGTDALDASLSALLAPLGPVDATSPLGLTTLAELDRQLVVAGGMHRFLADTYYGGGQWPLLSCFLGLAWSAAGERGRALELLRWSAATSADGSLPEQVDHHLLDAGSVQQWVERWGASADPLLWSSAMYLRLAVELGIVEGSA
jgi:GH15 family glucan-1,4-alpha-glucosidase